MTTMNIGSRVVGDAQPCFIIAEAGVNHNGSLDIALRLVDAAAEAGSDAVKFQTFRAESVVSVAAPKADYQKQTPGAVESQLEMIRKLEMSPEMTRAVARHAGERGILFLSTGFDEESVDLLNEIGVPAFKIGSGDVTNTPLLQHIGRKRLPVILSTGMSYMVEVEAAVEALTAYGCPALALLHCVSSYPATPEWANLRAMNTLRQRFHVPIGFSDHFLELELAYAAVAMGACIIEKHLTLDNSLPGPDHRVSLSPERFSQMVSGIRNVEAALGDGVKQPSAIEKNVRDVARRSIVAAEAIPAGTVITQEMLAFKRPGTGVPPTHLDRVVGRTTKSAIERDAAINLGDLS